MVYSLLETFSSVSPVRISTLTDDTASKWFVNRKDQYQQQTITIYNMLYKKILQQLVFTHKTFIVCTLFGLSTLQSCSDKQPSLLPIKSVEFKLDTDVKMSDMFNDYTFIQLESNDDCIIPDITQLYDVNDTLVVLSNTGDVYTFDRNTGKYYGQISGKVKGQKNILRLVILF